MDGITGISSVGNGLAQQYRYMLQAIRDVKSGKVEGEEAPTHTKLTYKLDPDERGLLKSSNASKSMLAVTAQEIMNANRLSAEARARGEDVVSVSIDYKTDIVDGKLAVRAGHTEVVSRPRAEAEYVEVGRANQQAALSTHDPRLTDDAVLRSLAGGLRPADGTEPVTIPEISAREQSEASRGHSFWMPV